MKRNGATLLVECLVKQGVKYVFGIPGAKIDAVFDALLDSPIRFILCRHEQNAAFMAAAYGRLTGEPGVVLVTSGPGVANLATGLLTATTEGDPIVAIGGNVSLAMKLKASHQNTDNIKLMEAVTKARMEVLAVETIPEIIDNAFRIAKSPSSGAVFISLPQDIGVAPVSITVPEPLAPELLGAAHPTLLQQAVALIHQAKKPVVLLGQESSRPNNTKAIRALVEATHLPVVGTYQAAGTLSRHLLEYFCGRVGLFKNQPGDQLLNESDLVIAIGFNRVEYDPETWHESAAQKIIRIDYSSMDVTHTYRPAVALIGDIAETVTQLTPLLKPYADTYYQVYKQDLLHTIETGEQYDSMPVHPLRFIKELRALLDDETIVAVDIGSVYMWMARYFLSFKPHHLLFSNGQQTLGVALPWALAAKLANPQKTVVSISGDGGFLFSSMELETAVREKISIVHFVWVDGSYDMVKEQQLMKYQRESAVHLGAIDVIRYAESFGARGYKVTQIEELVPIVKAALAEKGPVVIEIPIDYRDNPSLFAMVKDNIIH